MDDARSRLLESTQELLWERGYTGTSPRAIQERAGVGQGSMYHHFSGKRDLAAAAIRQTTEEFLPGWRAVLAGPGTPLERLEAWLRRERDILRGCRIGRLVQDKEVVDDEALRGPIDEVFSGTIGVLAGLLREGQESGEVRAGIDPDQVAAMILSVVQGGYVVARAHQDPERFTAAVEGVLALVAAPGR
ncbi:TetR family transcriptional regulator [Motilibacter rhizosphaerae]|uniref:TetR family transcriptional regulator n=1 Tax=Motilibacter rhizosphaerae TaxID=598652 RepID=A0A4Q7NS83_9ACTN|nr:TetR/AcrR family transcriptional regulator [Motilibacter rhizosphaerae]RZS89983.1 TetR family transcriptional regulator [Motilibacter rhizosphaerae]